MAAMNAIETLTTRASALKLTEPAPSPAEMEIILSAAVRAPDHGKLRPWSFLLVRGDARERLGDVFAEALLARDPDAPRQMVDAERLKPMRAPLLIVVAATADPDHPKIPEIEQVMSASCAAMNMFLAAHALGYGCMWKTGAPAYDKSVKSALGLAPRHHIVAILYIGTHAMPPADIRRPNPADFVREWDGKTMLAGA